tara:strand:+ start:3297 stop:4157 length:861 start_codon:yes stop_codon:yes gene_type:complete
MTLKEIEKYAAGLQKRSPPRYSIKKSSTKPKLKILRGIKAVLIDIYGTVLTSSLDDLEMQSEKKAFTKTIKEFKLKVTEIDLERAYANEIKKEHHKKRKWVRNPEIKIEEIWDRILGRIGKKGVNKFEIAYFFDWVSDKNKPYPGTFETLKKLRTQGIKIGIVSNSQFYTPINLNIVLKHKSKGRIKRWQDFFTAGLCALSYKEGFSKPNPKLFTKPKSKFKASEMLMIGNDMLKDIRTAQKAGLRTVLFAGDKKSLRLHRGSKSVKGVKPDAIITDWKQLLRVVK